MVTLPDQWLDLVLVDTRTSSLLLYLKNSADEYLTCRQPLDKAFTLQENLDKFAQSDFAHVKVQVVTNASPLTIEVREPSTQDWKPVPIPLDGVTSVKQQMAILSTQQHTGSSNVIR